MVLHTCCGPCLSGCLEVLGSESGSPVLYYSNSNICDRDEWQKRLDSLVKLAEYGGYRLEIDPYDHESWKNAVAGHEADREGGSRCSLCFYHNLQRTALFVSKSGFDRFATTLTVSHYKNSQQIFAEGLKLPLFESLDFKIIGNVDKGRDLVKRLGLYRQKFCGCEYSRRSP